ncbi:MAG: cytochrome c peroxidase [Planctomycetota bacterium]
MVQKYFVSLGLIFVAGSAIYSAPKSVERDRAMRRRPVALFTVPGVEQRLFVANRASGSVSVIDLESNEVAGEHRVGTSIAHAVPATNEALAYVIDEATRELKLLELSSDGVRSVRTIAKLPHSASRLVAASTEQRVFVSTKWSRRVVRASVNDGGSKSVRLPFVPLELCLAENDRTLVVASAFGGELAVVDAETLQLRSVRSLQGHNIRGLAYDVPEQELLIAHQKIVPGGIVDYEELHWGRLVTNAVQAISLEKLHDKKKGPLKGWLRKYGGIGGATGDPGGLALGDGEVLAVSFSGSREVSIQRGHAVNRVSVGSRPTALSLVGEHLFVANELDDTISVLSTRDVASAQVVSTISLGRRPKRTAVERGERLFFDARVSHEAWMSCHSCHTDGHSADLVVDTLGDGDYGAPKRVPSLLGTKSSAPWGWTGRAKSLEDQIRSSVDTTMHGALTNEQVNDLRAYLETLKAPPSANEKRGALAAQGQSVFREQGCADCHAPPRYTSKRVVEVGLMDEKKRRRFNPPSLLGVGQRGRFFHDGRAKRLSDVFAKYRHQVEDQLSPKKLEALLAYLRSL